MIVQITDLRDGGAVVLRRVGHTVQVDASETTGEDFAHVVGLAGAEADSVTFVPPADSALPFGSLSILRSKPLVLAVVPCDSEHFAQEEAPAPAAPASAWDEADPDLVLAVTHEPRLKAALESETARVTSICGPGFPLDVYAHVVRFDGVERREQSRVICIDPAPSSTSARSCLYVAIDANGDVLAECVHPWPMPGERHGRSQQP